MAFILWLNYQNLISYKKKTLSTKFVKVHIACSSSSKKFLKIFELNIANYVNFHIWSK